ncbi:MAG: hypothetical protein ACYC9R_06220 [Nitrosotalea sp.]
MRIRVNNVGEETSKKSTKGFYKVFTLAYTSDGKDRTRDIPNFNKETYTALKAASAGDEFDISLVKNGEYTNWDKVEKAVSQTPALLNSSFKKTSTYETPEERAQRQVYIIRQSSISSAVALKPKADVQEIIDVADEFVHYVLNGLDLDTTDNSSAANSVE